MESGPAKPADLRHAQLRHGRTMWAVGMGVDTAIGRAYRWIQRPTDGPARARSLRSGRFDHAKRRSCRAASRRERAGCVFRIVQDIGVGLRPTRFPPPRFDECNASSKDHDLERAEASGSVTTQACRIIEGLAIRAGRNVYWSGRTSTVPVGRPHQILRFERIHFRKDRYVCRVTIRMGANVWF